MSNNLPGGTFPSNNLAGGISQRGRGISVPTSQARDAYQLAKLKDPSIGTLDEWLATLPGLNAYQLALQGAPGVLPFEGTLADWLLAQKGEDGSSIVLQLSATHIQWRVADTDDEWSNLVALADLKGQDSTVPGPPIALRVEAGNVEWQVVGAADWTQLITVAELTGQDSTVPGPTIALRVEAGNVEWQVVGDTGWVFLIALSTLTGAPSTVPGPNVELQANTTHIQWRVSGSESSWTDLIPLTDITGPAGTEVLVDPVRTTCVGNGIGPGDGTVFAVSGAAGLTNPAALLVAIDGVMQEPGEDYTIGGVNGDGNLVFTSPLPIGSKAVVISPVNSLQVGQVTPSDGSVTSAKLDANIQVAGNFAAATGSFSGAVEVGGQLTLPNQILADDNSVVTLGLLNSRLVWKESYLSYRTSDGAFSTPNGTVLVDTGLSLTLPVGLHRISIRMFAYSLGSNNGGWKVQVNTSGGSVTANTFFSQFGVATGSSLSSVNTGFNAPIGTNAAANSYMFISDCIIAVTGSPVTITIQHSTNTVADAVGYRGLRTGAYFEATRA